jgi:hypothetical protein
LSDKKGAGAWIGGSSFDAVSGNATTVAKITCLLISLQFSTQVRPSNPGQDEVRRRMLNDLWACSASIVLKTWCPSNSSKNLAKEKGLEGIIAKPQNQHLPAGKAITGLVED